MKEKPREKVKEEAETEVEETEVQSEAEEAVETVEEAHTPEVEIKSEIVKPSEATEEITPQVTESVTKEIASEAVLMPSWGGTDQSEWMYGIPSREEDEQLWAEEWADFLLEWTEHQEVHVLSLATIIAEPPFKDLRNKVDSFKKIAKILIDKEVAEWTDRKKRQLRVYWKPLEDWADYIYEWALRTGKLRLDVKSIVIQESGEPFAKLPEKDLYVVLALMVEKEFAVWVDKNKGAILVNT